MARTAVAVLALGLLATVAQAAVAEALEERYFHRTWRRGDGLPGNSVYAIAQSADGYLWVGTANGLARFDGQNFMVYRDLPAGVFRSRFVAALLAARDGRLWIGTERGLLVLRGGEVARDGAAGGRVSEAAVTALAEDAGGDLWIGTRSGLLRRRATGDATQVGLAGLRVSHLLAGEAGEVWIGTETRGAWHLRDGKLAPLGGNPHQRQESVTGLVRDLDGSILVFAAGGGRRVRADGGVAPGGFAELNDVVAAASGAGSLWLATANRGLIQTAGGQSRLASPELLANALISDIFVAADRTVWLGSAGDGLHQLVEKSCSTYTRHDGLANDRTESVLLDANGSVWVGTVEGLTEMARGPGGVVAIRAELPGTEVGSLLLDHLGQLWAGTSHGLARRLVDGRWQRLPPWGGPATQVVGTLYEDSAHRLWVATAGGLGVIPAGQERVAAVAGLEGQELTGLAEASDGSLWIGTRGAGLLRLWQGRLETLRSAAELPIVTEVQPGSSHDMWVGTFGNGLLHYRSGRWYQFDESNGLPDNTVRQLLEDPRGDLWICSGAGISRASGRVIAEVEAGRLAAISPFSYGPEDGIAESVCYGFAHPGAARSADGHLWFATSHGLVEIRPERLEMQLSSVAPRLDAVSIDGREVVGGGSARLEIPTRTRRLDLRFSVPVFVAQRRRPMRYRLVGFDREWVGAGDERLARYTLLPPAIYHFEVEVRDERNGWSPARQLVELEVQPLFYQRRGFALIVALALAGAALFLHRWTARRLRRRAGELERLVLQRTTELQEANRQLEALATIDSLTGLANRRMLQETLEKEVRRCARSQSEISLILLDVDCFKGYNDALGHVSGDECLHRLGAVLRSAATRAVDLAARYGGEEFAVLLPDTPAEEAYGIAEALRQRVQRLAIPHPASPAAGCVTISVGVAGLVPAFGFPPARLIERADVALYLAKTNGRNQVQLSTEAAPEAAGERRRPAKVARRVSSAA